MLLLCNNKFSEFWHKIKRENISAHRVDMSETIYGKFRFISFVFLLKMTVLLKCQNKYEDIDLFALQMSGKDAHSHSDAMGNTFFQNIVCCRDFTVTVIQLSWDREKLQNTAKNEQKIDFINLILHWNNVLK